MTDTPFQLQCPLPLRHATVQMAHGGGGRLMRELIEGMFLGAFGGTALQDRHDASVLPVAGERLAFTTDTFVVSPRFFPGGDIGELAVYGTVNDLACGGALPAYLSVGFVLEEGLPMEELARIVASMKAAADRCGVAIVTGDTKVVDRGKGDGIFINTAGIGFVPSGVDLRPRRVQPGDAILVSGDLGRHGIAVMSVREGLAFEVPVTSDCGPVHHLAAALLQGAECHCFRDPTRGGLAAVLNEIALDAALALEVDERAVPLDEGVQGACELLGLDPLYVACEGRLVAFVAGADSERALQILRASPGGEGAAIIGRVTGVTPAPAVTLRTRVGTPRLLDLLSGEQLPRIC